MSAFKKYHTGHAVSLENVYHPSELMLPINRVPMPQLASSFFSPSDFTLINEQTSFRLQKDRQLAWKKPAFRYKTKLGRFPKEAPAYMYIQRKDPWFKVVRTVPEMVYPIVANRLPVPKHELLEDDYRAYHSALQNMYVIFRKKVLYGDRLEEYNCLNEIVGRIIRNKSGRQPVQLLVESGISTVTSDDKMAIYKDSMTSPAGYFFRYYQRAQGKDKKLRPSNQNTVTKTAIRDPFQNTFAAPEGVWRCEETHWDPDVIAGGLSSKITYIYNEPEAVPVSSLPQNFSKPLTARVEQIVTGQPPLITDDASRVAASHSHLITLEEKESKEFFKSSMVTLL